MLAVAICPVVPICFSAAIPDYTALVEQWKYHGVIVCDTGLSRNDFAGFPQHTQPGRYFGGNMVDVITPREAWIEHDTEILELVDPILKVLSKAETLKIATLESL